MAANQRHPFMQFWDFIQSLDPQQRNHGEGVDRHPPPPFPPGFPFGGPHHPPGPHPAWAGPEADFQHWSPWGHPGNWDHWGHHGHPHDHPARHPHDPRESRQQTPPTPTDDEQGQRFVNDEKHPDTVMDDESATAAPDPEEVVPEDSDEYDRPNPAGRRWGRHGSRFCGRGGRGGRGHRGHRGGRGGPPRGPPPPPFHHHHPFQRPQPPFAPPPPPYHGPHAASAPPAFDFSAMLQTLGGLGSHPFVENLREQVQNYRDTQNRTRSGNNNNNNNNNNQDEAEAEAGEDEAFSPPIDIFNTPAAYILHVALPGAKKDDVGVNWDPDTSTLSIAGVVYRPGDEAFLQTMSTSERRVGLFDRSITLPPPGCQKDGEVDGMSISAKMEDGLLVVTVPKTEKEWTEIHKVDIE